jgi:hypothetical protein
VTGAAPAAAVPRPRGVTAIVIARRRGAEQLPADRPEHQPPAPAVGLRDDGPVPRQRAVRLSHHRRGDLAAPGEGLPRRRRHQDLVAQCVAQDPFKWWMRITQTNQGWKMFAPNPPRSNLMMRVLVTDTDGEVYDLNTDVYHPANRPIPWLFYSRIRKINRRIVGAEGGKGEWYQKWHGRYICRQWALRPRRRGARAGRPRQGLVPDPHPRGGRQGRPLRPRGAHEAGNLSVAPRAHHPVRRRQRPAAEPHPRAPRPARCCPRASSRRGTSTARPRGTSASPTSPARPRPQPRPASCRSASSRHHRRPALAPPRPRQQARRARPASHYLTS